MIYPSVSSAVVSALAAESKSGVKGQAWQKLYDSSEEIQRDLASLVRSAGETCDRGLVDDWVAARLHHLLIPRHWWALIAKYSTHKAKKVQAIGELKPLIASPASQLFIYKAVTAWAIPKLAGKRIQSVRSVSVDVPLNAPAWRRDALVKSAVAAARASKRAAELRSADMIILPDSFYDMNTWDPDAAPESTRRRWRAGINEKLDGMVSEALLHAEEILHAEGVLSSGAA